MLRPLLVILAAGVLTAQPAFAQEAWNMPGEDKVDPYVVSDANAGITPITDPRVLAAFHGKAGVQRIVDLAVASYQDDPRISDIFKSTDLVRLKRTLFEQLCYVLGGGCAYTGRDMATTHKDMGLQASDMNALVEDLQRAMAREGVPFTDQNKLLAKLAPQKRNIVTR